jgi:hypothetical protein
MQARDEGKTIAAAQAAFYLFTGVWPFLSRRSFELVTGPKTDFWLVHAVGVTVSSIGLGLARAARSDEPLQDEVATVALASAVGLAALDVAYVLRRRISRVYLFDAAVETALAVGWLRRARTTEPPSGEPQ